MPYWLDSGNRQRDAPEAAANARATATATSSSPLLLLPSPNPETDAPPNPSARALNPLREMCDPLPFPLHLQGGSDPPATHPPATRVTPGRACASRPRRGTRLRQQAQRRPTGLRAGRGAATRRTQRGPPRNPRRRGLTLGKLTYRRGRTTFGGVVSFERRCGRGWCSWMGRSWRSCLWRATRRFRGRAVYGKEPFMRKSHLLKRAVYEKEPFMRKSH